MPTIRLFVQDILSSGAQVTLRAEQSHYLLHVMRMREGEVVILFNGKDGKWEAEITSLGKKSSQLSVINQRKPQRNEPDIWLAFAPIKNVALHFMAQKATELGCSALMPVITDHTVVHHLNTEKLRANAVEAAEQSERLTVPVVHSPKKLLEFLDSFPSDRMLVFCDESGQGRSLIDALGGTQAVRFALLIGPEGGFSPKELDILHRHPHVVAVGLGPRILRADTAALAGLACLQAVCGDWKEVPRFKPSS